MRKIFILSMFLFSCAAFSMQNVQLPKNSPIETAELVNKYQNLRKEYNNNNSTIMELENSYSEFNDSIFCPVAHNTDPTSLLKKSRKILENINNALANRNPNLPYLSASLEEQILPRLKNRIDLARLDENVFNGFGSLKGLNNFNNIDLYNKFADINLQNAIRTLTGRIFQIELVDGVVDIAHSSIFNTSSGTMISFDQLNQQIENLPSHISTNLNSVLTCAHALFIKEGRAKFYFVPTSQLDLTTGFPVGVNSINGNGGLIHFLENNQNAYPLDRLHIKNRILNHWRQYDLDMGQPQFLDKEDLVIGHINMLNRNQPAYNINYEVSFQPININNESRYFATGYPGCDHYSLDSFNLHEHYNLLQEESLSPFLITSSIKNAQNPVTINANGNGSMVHRCPSSSGMSGGAIFHFLSGINRINIFGIITSGEDTNENGCHWH